MFSSKINRKTFDWKKKLPLYLIGFKLYSVTTQEFHQVAGKIKPKHAQIRLPNYFWTAVSAIASATIISFFLLQKLQKRLLLHTSLIAQKEKY